MDKKKIWIVIILVSFLISCGGVVGVKQSEKVRKSIPSKYQNTFRAMILERKIRVLYASYTYDFLPITNKKTLIVTRGDWLPYVNTDLQGICTSLGGSPVTTTLLESFEGKHIGFRKASENDLIWGCMGGRDPFSVRIYVSSFAGTRLTLPVTRFVGDVYIIVNHLKEQPLLFTKDIKKLYDKYSALEPFSWEKFFETQKVKNIFLALHKSVVGDAQLLEAKKLIDGSWKALYATKITGTPKVIDRFFPLVHFITLCYAKNGKFIEDDPRWIEKWVTFSVANSYFYCNSDSVPFTMKVKPGPLTKIKFSSQYMDTFNYWVYVKNGIELLDILKISRGYEDKFALQVAVYKKYTSEKRGILDYKGIYLGTKSYNGKVCDKLAVIVVHKETQKRKIINYTICNNKIVEKAESPNVQIDSFVENLIWLTKEKAKRLGTSVTEYKDIYIIAKQATGKHCIIEVQIFRKGLLTDWHVYDECKTQ